MESDSRMKTRSEWPVSNGITTSGSDISEDEQPKKLTIEEMLEQVFDKHIKNDETIVIPKIETRIQKWRYYDWWIPFRNGKDEIKSRRDNKQDRCNAWCYQKIR